MSDLFSRSFVKIDLQDAPAIQDGDRVVVSEEMIEGLLEAFRGDLSQYVKAGHVCRLDIQKNVFPNESGVTETFNSVGLGVPFSKTTIEQVEGGSIRRTMKGAPGIFVTREFLLHLQPVENSECQWQLVR